MVETTHTPASQELSAGRRWHWRCRATGCDQLAARAVILVIPKYRGATEAHTLINVRLCAAHADLRAVAADIKASGLIESVARLMVASGHQAPELERARWRLVELRHGLTEEAKK